MHLGLSYIHELQKRWKSAGKTVPFDPQKRWNPLMMPDGMPEGWARDLHRMDAEVQRCIRLLEADLHGFVLPEAIEFPTVERKLMRWGPKAWRFWWMRKALKDLHIDLEKQAWAVKKTKRSLIQWKEEFELWVSAVQELRSTLNNIDADWAKDIWVQGIKDRAVVLASSATLLHHRSSLLLDVLSKQEGFHDQALRFLRDFNVHNSVKADDANAQMIKVWEGWERYREAKNAMLKAQP